MFSGLLGLGIAGAVGAGAGVVMDSMSKNSSKNEAALRNYNNTVKKYLNGDESVETVLRELNAENLITKEQYKAGLNTLKSYTDLYKNSDGKISVSDFLNYTGINWADSGKDTRELIELMTKKIPHLQYTDYKDSDLDLNDINSLVTRPGDSIAGAPAPTYEDVNFEGYQRDVEPVHLWTGQELADLHNINYDVNHYYDLIKQGTTAEVNRANYEAALSNEASMVNDTATVNNYLDSLRNNKADAVSTGITAGAQAAADILTNKDTLNNYATNQASVAQERYNIVDSALQADAESKIAARDYFNSLAKNFTTNSASIYASDTDRYAQDVLSNAEMYAADQALRGQRAYSNASMAGTYTANNAMIDAYKDVANQQADEYKWVWDTFLKANRGNIKATKHDVNEYIDNRYKNNMGFLNYATQLNK